MEIRTFGNCNSERILIQMVDDHDLEVIDNEVAHIKSGDFRLITVKVNNWNTDLSPWTAPPVFGNTPFGEGAADTLSLLTRSIIPSLGCSRAELFIGGYSLAGLFALWATCNTSIFRGVVAASPSVWFPGFADYVKNNPVRTQAVYLSLGDREEKTRNPVMATVGNAIREVHETISGQGVECTLEWNEGNHFREPDLRTAKGFSWVLEQTGKVHRQLYTDRQSTYTAR